MSYADPLKDAAFRHSLVEPSGLGMDFGPKLAIGDIVRRAETHPDAAVVGIDMLVALRQLTEAALTKLEEGSTTEPPRSNEAPTH